MFIHAWSWLTIYTMCDMVCLCKVVCVGDWKLILLRLVICLVLLFSFVLFFQVILSQVSPSDFHVRRNRPHAESIEISLPLPALGVPSWISGGVTAEVNRVPSEGRDEGDSCCIWCCTGSREQSRSALFIVQSCCLQDPAQRPGQMEC